MLISQKTIIQDIPQEAMPLQDMVGMTDILLKRQPNINDLIQEGITEIMIQQKKKVKVFMLFQITLMEKAQIKLEDTKILLKEDTIEFMGNKTKYMDSVIALMEKEIKFVDAGMTLMELRMEFMEKEIMSEEKVIQLVDIEIGYQG